MPHMNLFSYIRSSLIDPLPSQPNINNVNNRTFVISLNISSAKSAKNIIGTN